MTSTPQRGIISRRLTFTVAVIFAFVSMIRDFGLMKAFSFTVTWDSPSYLQISTPLRSLPYPLLNVLVDAFDNPYTIVLLQIVISAAALGSLVYVVSEMNLVVGLGIGILLLSEYSWSAVNIDVMSESTFTSFHVLSLACLLNHYRRRRVLKLWELIGAGLLYAWTFTLRQSGLLLAVPVVLAYLWFTASWRKAAQVAAALILVLVASATMNLFIFGHFQLSGDSGYYLAFPLYIYQLFSPDNGPVSEKVDRINKVCMPDLDYSRIIPDTSDDIIWSHLVPCWQSRPNGEEEFSRDMSAAYVEGVTSHPLQFAQAVFQQTAFSLSYPTSTYGLTPIFLNGGANDCVKFTNWWCPVSNEHLTDYPQMQAQFATTDVITALTGPFKQIYLVLAAIINGGYPVQGFGVWRLFDAIAFALWVMMSLVVVWVTRGAMRLMIFSGFCFILCNSLTIAIGQHFVIRYTIPFEPFHIILSVVAFWLFFRWIIPFLHGVIFRRRRMRRQTAQAGLSR